MFRHAAFSRFERVLLIPAQETKEDAIHRVIGKKTVYFKKVCEGEAVSAHGQFLEQKVNSERSLGSV